jgi:hypothetical protein
MFNRLQVLGKITIIRVTFFICACWGWLEVPTAPHLWRTQV